MSFLDNINAAVRRKIHQREIDESLRHFEHHTGHEAETKQTFADMGTFRSQVDRLFSLGNAAETAEAKKIAESTIGSTLTNRYYRAADYLSVGQVLESPRARHFTGTVRCRGYSLAPPDRSSRTTSSRGARASSRPGMVLALRTAIAADAVLSESLVGLYAVVGESLAAEPSKTRAA